MLRTRPFREADERRRLAPYAQRVSDSVGRDHPEDEHAFRTAFERDRARIIHCPAFRRLEYKTQVFLNGTGDHLRTRLTHTIEVASIARAMAAALGANEDLAEAIALAHDLGHPPFGHAGEEALNRLMAEHGGFEHNRQALRVVTLLESKFGEFPGLNLTYEVLEGLRKHDGVHHRPGSPGVPPATFPHPSLEAQLADAADAIAYYSHDLDDGLDHGLLSEKSLAALEIWQTAASTVHRRWPGTTGKEFRANVIRTITDGMVESVVEMTHRRLTEAGLSSADEVRRFSTGVVGAAPEVAGQMRELRAFLFANLYHHAEVADVNAQGIRVVGEVFHDLMAHPGKLARTYAQRVPAEGLARCVADYVSGMTDRYIAQVAAAVADGPRERRKGLEAGKTGL